MGPTLQEEERLQCAIDDVMVAVRAGRSGDEERKVLSDLVSQLRMANQNLVLASVRAQVLQEEAEERNRQQNEFLAMLAHELRNPMAPIGNAASLLAKITSAHPLLPQIQGVISRQVEHMARLINDLLDASRITSGKLALQKSRFNLHELVDRSVEIVLPSIEQRQQQFTVETTPENVWIEGDLIRLSQALSNLLINASKFTHDKGEIRLNISRQDGVVRLKVEDNGVGIEQDMLPRIFDLFKQGPRTLARSEGGLGIGLSVAKGLVEMHGGSIGAYSQGGGLGSEFEISLPVAMDEVANTVTPSPSMKSTSLKGLHILIIEDNQDTNSTLHTLLEMEGHQVSSAYDGLTGLALALEKRCDVLICDIGLPGLNGYGVIAQLRQRKDKSQPFAIALSGYGQPEDKARALDAGFDHYMVKPVKDETLLYLLDTQ